MHAIDYTISEYNTKSPIDSCTLRQGLKGPLYKTNKINSIYAGHINDARKIHSQKSECGSEKIKITKWYLDDITSIPSEDGIARDILYTYKDSIITVDFCDLPRYKGKMDRVVCKYQRVEEYWGLDPKRASANVQLSLKDHEGLPKCFKKSFEKFITITGRVV